MWKNYLKIAYRNLLKNKMFSLINIVGLGIGMAAFLLILQYVSFEQSYDDFRRTTVYRISEHSFMNGELVGKRAQTSPALAPALQSEIPEIIQAARLVHTAPLMSDPVLQVEERSFHEEKIYFADSAFLDLMSFKMLSGNPDHALSQPGSVVMSGSMANKYFPGQDALGQSLTFYMGERGNTQLKVTGVFEDTPANSHLNIDFMISFSSLPWNLDENWDWGNFYNYIEILPASDPMVVKHKLYDVLENYRGEILAEWRKEGYYQEFDLQPVQSIHLSSDLEAEAEPNGSQKTVTFLTLISFFILIIAWINYLNLTTAKSVERAKEIGIRKVVGSNRKQLIAQFMTESLMVNLLAALLALTFSQLLIPVFRTLTQGHFTSTITFEMGMPIAGIFLVGTFLSGLYPALMLSSFQPLQVIKGGLKTSKQGLGLRKGLVVFQFAASIALIAGTLAVRQQLFFMQQQDRGINMEQTLIVKGPGIKDSTYQDHLAFFKSEVINLPDVQEVSVSSNVPGRELSWARGFYQPAKTENRTGVNIIAVDENFFDLYEASFSAGRNFSLDFPSDRGAVIFNETAIRQLGFENPEEAIQQSIIWDEADNDQHSKEIIGVIRDFHQESLHKEVGPMVFVLKRYLYAPWAGEYYSLKIQPTDFPSTLKEIQASWEKAFPNSPFESFFLNDYFNSQYQSDQQFARIFSLFAYLAILIACLGLFGLSSYMTIQRTKEIGIRKVMGASILNIMTLLSQDFLRLLLTASIIIFPVLYYVVKHWLQNYAYQMEMQWWLFALPIILVWLLAFTCISFQSIKTALANPVRALRYE